jgi:hypothetical protein
VLALGGSAVLTTVPSTPIMAWDLDNANVGIGTSSPSSLLTVGTAGVAVGSAFNSKFNVNGGTLGSTTGDTAKIANLGFDAAINNHVGLGITAYRNLTGSDWTTTGIKFTYDVDNTTAVYDNLLCFQGGNVGIGTSSPAVKLDVTGTSRSTVGIMIGSATDNSTGGFSRSGGDTYLDYAGVLHVRSGAASERLTLTAAGNFGIGVSTSLLAKLDIGGGQSNQLIVRGTNTNTVYGVLSAYDDDSNGGKAAWGSNAYVNTTYANTLSRFNTANSGWGIIGGVANATYESGSALTFNYVSVAGATSEFARFSSGGQFLVGTQTTSGGEVARFQSTGDTYVGIIASTASSSYLNFGDTSDGNVGFIGYNHPSNYMNFRTNGSEAMRIDSSQNLLVGALSNTYGGSNVILSSSSIVSGLATSSGYSNINSAQLEGPSGRVIANHINGTTTGSIYVGFAYNAGGIGSITQSGTTAVLFNTTSDQRLKENIQDADSASSLIDAIQVRQFDWKSDGSHTRYGFVAQELVTVAPEAVHQPENTDEMMAVDYSKLVPMLVKEIQSLRQRLSAANL